MSFRGRTWYGQSYTQNYRGRHSKLKIIEMTLGVEILEKHIIIEVRIIEVDVETTTETTIEIITEMTIMEEVDVGLEKGNFQVIIEGMIKVVTYQDQV